MSETDTAPEAPPAEASEAEETTAAAPSPTLDPPKPEAPKPTPPKDTWTPPSKAEFEALQAKLKETNAESAARRKKLEAFERERESEQEKAIREAVEAANEANKPRIVKAEAKLVLLGADARPERVAALTRFLDMDKITVDGDNVSGLEDQVEKLKSEYPEFFKQPETEQEPAKPPTPKVPVANKPAADGPRSLGERVLAASQHRK